MQYTFSEHSILSFILQAKISEYVAQISIELVLTVSQKSQISVKFAPTNQGNLLWHCVYLTDHT